MDAHLHITGNVGKDVDFREATGDKSAWATFRLAHTPSYRRGNEWVEHPTTWIKVSCRRSLAENVHASLRVGDRVMVQGRLRTDSWVDQRTGEMREQHVLEADAVGHDLRFGTTANYRKTTRRRDGAPATAAAGRGGDDPWTGQQGDDAVPESPAEPEMEAVG